MSERPKAWIAWSSGKDSAWSLHVARQQGDVEIVGMLTTITDIYSRVTMHGVREELLKAQADAAGLPLHCVRIPTPCPNDIYEAAMAEALHVAKSQGITHVVFGDLFLEDLKRYREEKLAQIGMTGCFPLWLRDTKTLARDMIAGGIRAYLTCIDTRYVPASLAGHEFNTQLLEALPDTVDPCGENGEFHSFVWDGPMFDKPVKVKVGETVAREGYLFTDLEMKGPCKPTCHCSHSASR